MPRPRKVQLIERLADAGLPVVEATSFVSPRAVPQLADADEVLPAVHRRPGVRYPVLVPNMRGLERALAAGADAVAVFTAASEAFTRANIGMTIAESLLAFAPVLAARAGPRACGRAATSRRRSAARTQGAVEPAVVAGVAAALRGAGLRADLDRRHDRRRPARAGARGRRCRRGVGAGRARSPCTCTTPAGGRSRTSRPASTRACASSTPRPAAWAAARSPRARRATSPPRRSSASCTSAATRRASTLDAVRAAGLWMRGLVRP